MFDRTHRYFTEFTISKASFYGVAIVYFVTVLLVAFVEPFISISCMDASAGLKEYPNPDYEHDYCFSVYRAGKLLYLTREELCYTRRLIVACVLGGVIGWERRQADRPAGIRTMGLVSLASALFACSSTLAFRDGPQEWDASRISAAIPSGVGFLGAGIIFKEPVQNKDSGGIPVVHGLTTAASLWMSAAVGIACGGGLFLQASFTVAILLVLLRFGPRVEANDEDDDDDEAVADEQEPPSDLRAVASVGDLSAAADENTQLLLTQSSRASMSVAQSQRKRKGVKVPSLMSS